MTTARPPSISLDERRQRLNALRIRMDKTGVGGVLLGSTTSLRYFTGIVWHSSERFLGALILPDPARSMAFTARPVRSS